MHMQTAELDRGRLSQQCGHSLSPCPCAMAPCDASSPHTPQRGGGSSAVTAAAAMGYPRGDKAGGSARSRDLLAAEHATEEDPPRASPCGSLPHDHPFSQRTAVLRRPPSPPPPPPPPPPPHPPPLRRFLRRRLRRRRLSAAAFASASASAFSSAVFFLFLPVVVKLRMGALFLW